MLAASVMAFTSPVEPTLSLHVLQEGTVSVPVRQLWVHLRGHCGVAEEVSGAFTNGQGVGRWCPEGGASARPQGGPWPQGSGCSLGKRMRRERTCCASCTAILGLHLREGGGPLSLGCRYWEDCCHFRCEDRISVVFFLVLCLVDR